MPHWLPGLSCYFPWSACPSTAHMVIRTCSSLTRTPLWSYRLLSLCIILFCLHSLHFQPLWSPCFYQHVTVFLMVAVFPAWLCPPVDGPLSSWKSPHQVPSFLQEIWTNTWPGIGQVFPQILSNHSVLIISSVALSHPESFMFTYAVMLSANTKGLFSKNHLPYHRATIPTDSACWWKQIQKLQKEKEFCLASQELQLRRQIRVAFKLVFWRPVWSVRRQ